jgi:hypothetical protein
MNKHREGAIRQLIAFIDRIVDWNLATLLPQGDDKKWNGYNP